MLRSVRYTFTLCLFFYLYFGTVCQAQNFKNGDLEGDHPGLSHLPDFWDNVPFTDINCLASEAGTDTPNLASRTEPVPEYGLAGIPYSGKAFMLGSYAISNGELVYHEGIMQAVSGFVPGNTYRINFFQAISRDYSCRDTSGSWAVFLNDSLLGISASGKSLISYMSITLEWEEREMSFIAEEESYLIKFLPWDDDLIHDCDSTLLDGGLRIGLDCIRIINQDDPITTNQNDVIIYPNPTKGDLNIKLEGHNSFKEIQLIDTGGRVLEEYPSLRSNQKAIKLTQPSGVYFIKVVTDKETSIHKVLKY